MVIYCWFLFSGPGHLSVLHSGLVPAGAVLHVDPHASAASLSPAGGTRQEVSRS